MPAVVYGAATTVTWLRLILIMLQVYGGGFLRTVTRQAAPP
jgi:hypothetical protein